jgi:hypothetical protein
MGFATEDPKLQLMIEAILKGKGFEDAQAGIAAVESSAAAATPAIEGTEGAVLGLNGALIPLTVGLSVLVPLIVQWFQHSDDATDSQKRLTEEIDKEYRALLPFLDKLKGTNVELERMAAVLQRNALIKQVDDMQKAGDAVNALKEKIEALKKGTEVSPGKFFLGPTTEAEIRSLEVELSGAEVVFQTFRDAMAEGLTVQQFLNKAVKDGTGIVREHKNALKEEEEEMNKLIAAEDRRLAKLDKEAEKRSQILEKEQDKDLEIMEKAQKENDHLALRRMINDKKIADSARQRALDIEQAHADEVTAARRAYANTATALSDVFNKNKALAIAGAIVDTWAGANKALNDPTPMPTYLRIALAAMVAAQGLANVMAIEKAAPGFDDPMSDMIASKLGRKSAADFVRLFGSGFHSGLVGMNGGGGTTNNTTINRGMSIQNMHMSGILAGTEKQMLVRLNRQLTTVAARHEQRTTLGR